jgi:hypothetical protein
MEQIGQFDQVRIVTTKNVRYLSAPPDVHIDPKGVWTVAAAIGSSELLLTKSNVTIRIPAADVLKVAEFGLDSIFNRLGRLSHGERTETKGDSEGSQRSSEHHQ